MQMSFGQEKLETTQIKMQNALVRHTVILDSATSSAYGRLWYHEQRYEHNLGL